MQMQIIKYITADYSYNYQAAVYIVYFIKRKRRLTLSRFNLEFQPQFSLRFHGEN